MKKKRDELTADNKLVILIVSLVTALVNVLFALTGVTGSLSCTVGQVASHLQAAALAATIDR